MSTKARHLTGFLLIGAARFAVDELSSETFEAAKPARLLATG